MAKKQVPSERNRNQKTPQTLKTNKTKTRNPPTPTHTENRNQSRNKASETGTEDASGEVNEALASPSSTTESQNDVESEDLIVEKEEKKKPKGKEAAEEEEKKKRQSEKDDATTKGAKRSSKMEDDDVVGSDAAEKVENALYTFPMNRVSRIIRSDSPDIRISQEAVFLINRASEKFLEVLCKEAYACLFLEDKSYMAYDHLSSVVAKRKRFEFLSDFVPEKVKFEDALAQIPEAE